MTSLQPEPSSFVREFMAAYESGEESHDEPVEGQEAEPDESTDESDEPESSDDDSDSGEESEDGDSGEDDEGADEVIPTTSEAPSSYNYQGVELDKSTVDQSIGIAQWWSQQPQEFVGAVNLLAQGSHIVVPREDWDRLQTASTTPTAPEEEPLDPVTFARVQSLEQRIAAQDQEIAAQREAEMQRRQSNIDVALASARKSFLESHTDMSEQEVLDLEGALSRSNTFPGYVNSAGGDVAKGYAAGMNAAYWSDPKYQTLELNKRLEAEREQAVETTNRKRKASALSGSGGSVSRNPSPPRNAQERRDAMVGEIESAINGGQQ